MDDHNRPQWFGSAQAAVAGLRALPANWDSYGAPRINEGCAVAALNLLLNVTKANTPRPAIVPTSRGGTQLEWHTRGVDLEVELLTPGRVLASYEDQRTGETWEKELLGDLTALDGAIARLSEEAC
jgi:hypothetical protein